jgi:CheY-like chemotaxis protein
MTQILQTRPRILVVEDDVLVRMDAFDSLEKAGFDVSQAGNADEAIRLLKNHDFYAIFTDIGCRALWTA